MNKEINKYFKYLIYFLTKNNINFIILFINYKFILFINYIFILFINYIFILWLKLLNNQTNKKKLEYNT